MARALDGLQVHVRPLRVDGVEVPVKYFNSGYDRAATKRLICIFQAHPLVARVYFNDRNIPDVIPLIKHDDHFHVALQGKT